VQHDAAILELPEGKQYVLVILSKNLSDEEAGKACIAGISQLIYNHVKSL
jgi:beta-lactamase class A